MSNIKLAILGDVCPTADTRHLFDAGNADVLFGNVGSKIKDADLSLCNVEFPMIDKGKPALKTGPILSGKTQYNQLFIKAGFNLVSLGNNHIKDYGEEGVLSTIDAFNKVDISNIGAGSNLPEAKKPFIKQLNGIKLGIITYAEQEFNTATQTSAGASYLDPYYDFDEIRKLKDRLDYLIILYHGGIEYYEYPSPLLQKKCRKMVESGADLVTCQHSHCIGSKENYLDGEILYGQGNGVFGYKKDNYSWNRGLLIDLEIQKMNGIANAMVKYIPIEAQPSGAVTLCNELDSRKVLEEFEGRSTKIVSPDFISSEWEKFCTKKKNLIIPQLLGYNRWLMHLNRLTKGLLTRLFFKNKNAMISHNLVRCEAHNEVVQTVLGKYKT